MGLAVSMIPSSSKLSPGTCNRLLIAITRHDAHICPSLSSGRDSSASEVISMQPLLEDYPCMDKSTLIGWTPEGYHVTRAEKQKRDK